MARTKKCPYCAEEIAADAIKCKHCGEFLGKGKGVAEPQKVVVKHKRGGLLTTLIVLAIIALILLILGV